LFESIIVPGFNSAPTSGLEDGLAGDEPPTCAHIRPEANINVTPIEMKAMPAFNHLPRLPRDARP
jgi:hypothetical protein